MIGYVITHSNGGIHIKQDNFLIAFHIYIYIANMFSTDVRKTSTENEIKRERETEGKGETETRVRRVGYKQ